MGYHAVLYVWTILDSGGRWVGAKTKQLYNQRNKYRIIRTPVDSSNLMFLLEEFSKVGNPNFRISGFHDDWWDDSRGE